MKKFLKKLVAGAYFALTMVPVLGLLALALPARAIGVAICNIGIDLYDWADR